MTLTEPCFLTADGGFDRAAIMADAWRRALIQFARPEMLFTSKAAALSFFLRVVWGIAKSNRISRETLAAGPVTIDPNSRTGRELATDGRIH
jgi:hypothetical protein